MLIAFAIALWDQWTSDFQEQDRIKSDKEIDGRMSLDRKNGSNILRLFRLI